MRNVAPIRRGCKEEVEVELWVKSDYQSVNAKPITFIIDRPLLTIKMISGNNLDMNGNIYDA